MENYTFEEFEDILDTGYQVYFTYLTNRYLLFKTTENCYTLKLIHVGQKNPPPRMSMVTKKYVMEVFPFMEDIEYKFDS